MLLSGCSLLQTCLAIPRCRATDTVRGPTPAEALQGSVAHVTSSPAGECTLRMEVGFISCYLGLNGIRRSTKPSHHLNHACVAYSSTNTVQSSSAVEGCGLQCPPRWGFPRSTTPFLPPGLFLSRPLFSVSLPLSPSLCVFLHSSSRTPCPTELIAIIDCPVDVTSYTLHTYLPQCSRPGGATGAEWLTRSHQTAGGASQRAVALCGAALLQQQGQPLACVRVRLAVATKAAQPVTTDEKDQQKRN